MLASGLDKSLYINTLLDSRVSLRSPTSLRSERRKFIVASSHRTSSVLPSDAPRAGGQACEGPYSTARQRGVYGPRCLAAEVTYCRSRDSASLPFLFKHPRRQYKLPLTYSTYWQVLSSIETLLLHFLCIFLAHSRFFSSSSIESHWSRWYPLNRQLCHAYAWFFGKVNNVSLGSYISLSAYFWDWKKGIFPFERGYLLTCLRWRFRTFKWAPLGELW